MTYTINGQLPPMTMMTPTTNPSTNRTIAISEKMDGMPESPDKRDCCREQLQAEGTAYKITVLKSQGNYVGANFVTMPYKYQLLNGAYQTTCNKYEYQGFITNQADKEVEVS